jgi:hypothetical protein
MYQLSEYDKKTLIKILEYLYYNNISDEEDYFYLSEIPIWLLLGSKEYLTSLNIKQIYRGSKIGYSDDGFSWTYDKDTAKMFGGTILNKEIPDGIISVDYIKNIVETKKLNIDFINPILLTYLLEVNEHEIIIPLKKL